MTVIDYIKDFKEKSLSKEEAIAILRNSNELSVAEKNLVIAYCYPRPLGDRELPNRVKALRQSVGNKAGWLERYLPETTLIIEAGQTVQYGRFIKHLMHAFCDPEKVFPVSGVETDECAICGKTVFLQDKWTEAVNSKETPEKERKEYLAYGSTDSKIILCLDCLVQLISAKEIMDTIDPGFLDWTKRYSKIEG